MGIDGTLLSLQSGDALQKELSSKSIELVCEEENCVDLIWKDQPAIPCTPVIYLTPSDAGLSVKEKVDLVSSYSNFLDRVLCIPSFRMTHQEYLYP